MLSFVPPLSLTLQFYAFKQVAFVENAESATMGKATGLGVPAAVGTTLSVLELVHSLQMGNGSVGSVLSSHRSTGKSHSSCC